MAKALPWAAISILASGIIWGDSCKFNEFPSSQSIIVTNMLAIPLLIMLLIHYKPSFIARNFNSMNSAWELFSDGDTLCYCNHRWVIWERNKTELGTLGRMSLGRQDISHPSFCSLSLTSLILVPLN